MGAKRFRKKECQFTIALGINWHLLEGAGRCLIFLCRPADGSVNPGSMCFFSEKIGDL